MILTVRSGAKLFVVALLIFAALTGETTVSGEANQSATDVPLLQLLATPEKYDGVLVRTIGFLWLEFEGNHLYLHREDFENGIPGQSVWLEFPAAPTAVQQKLRGNYVIVEGVFNAKNTGHMGLSTGALERITRLDLWSKSGSPRRRVTSN